MTPYRHCHCDGFKYLFDLPRELRDRIYHFAMTDMTTRVVINNRFSLSNMILVPHALPQLCFVNSQLYYEVVPVFMQRTRFIFTSPKIQQMHAFEKFVSGFKKGFESIRMLSISNIKGFAHSYFDDAFWPEALISRCTGLKSLILGGSARPLIHYLRDTPQGEAVGARLSTKEELQMMWGYASLSELKKLEYLKIQFIVSLRDLRKLGLEHAGNVSQNIRAVLEEAFEENKRKAVLIVEAEMEDIWYTYG